ncbi:angiomotin-like protein 1 [Arapaima gigas]
MDCGDSWIPEDVARWLDHIGVHHHPPDPPRENDADCTAVQCTTEQMASPGIRSLRTPVSPLDNFAYRYSDTVAFGGSHELLPLMVQQVIATDRELQPAEEPCFGVCIAPLPTHPAEREMRGSEDAASGTVLQRLMQEHLRCGGQPGDSGSLMTAPQPQPLSLPQGGAAPTPHPAYPAEELLQDEPQMGHQSTRQEPQGQEHQVDSAAMEKQGIRVVGPSPLQTIQNDEELPTYEEAKAQSQFYRGQQQPLTISTSYYLTGGPSASPASPVSPASPGPSCPTAAQKTRTEGRASVSRAGAAPPHRDEALKELKQGHVRSLSERIMQMSLERNGAKQHPPQTASSSTGRAPKSSPPPSLSSVSVSQAKGGTDPRGPPPEYPYRPKQTLSPAAKVPPASSPVDQGQLSNDQHLGGLMDQLRSFPLPQPTKTEITYVRYPSPPEYLTRQFPVTLSLQHHSPTSSFGATAPPRAQLQALPPPVPLTPQPSGDAFAVVARAQQMVEILSEENRALRQELQGYCEKAGKLQRFEAEIQKISEDYESLVKSSAKRESLDAAMKNKLEGEIRRLHDFNRDLRERLESANRQLASRDLEEQEGPWPLGLHLSQSRESVKEREKFEVEITTLRSANEDQRRHIEVLEQALNNAQGKVVKLEEELRKKRLYVDKVEKLQQALFQLQATCEKREQMERRLRTRLERELESLRAQQQRHGGLTPGSPSSDYNPPALMELLREKEERILALEADMTKWEQKYLEESAMRHFTMDAAATAAAQRDATIINHSRHGSYSDGSLDVRIWQEEEETSRRCQDMEYRIKNLHAQIIEKDAMIKVLQQRSRKEQGKAESAPLRPARSVPSISVATSLHLRQASHTGGNIPEERRNESGWKGSASVLLGKAPLETILPAATSSLPATPLLSTHTKMGSRDSCTQTDRSPEPHRAIPVTVTGRPRLSNTPSSSPVLRHTLARGTTDRTESPTTAVKSSHKHELPDTDVVEILI